jgi:manganese transport protein
MSDTVLETPGHRGHIASVDVPRNASHSRTFLAYLGPGLLVAVGYMDPGNWATDIGGGAQFGYLLISVILFSNFFAMLLQHLALKLGIVTGLDLAQACRAHYPRPVVYGLWILCEIAIVACDLAEVIGSAIALQLLFHLPLVIGVFVTAADILIILALQNRGFRYIEALVGALVLTIGGCFAYEMVISHASLTGALGGAWPSLQIVTNPDALYISIGILGATVMPHNLYLHSSIVQTRNYARTGEGRASAIRYATADSTLALVFAVFVNAAILILAAAAFHNSGHQQVADISDAYKLLSPVLGASFASVVFAVGLLASGQSSTLTGTLAGQIVMEGFLHLRLRPWVVRLLTRAAAVIPAAAVAAYFGERGIGQLLIFSQVILSAQLSFAVIPLVLFTGSKKVMGDFANPLWLSALSWVVAAIIFVLNLYLVWTSL